VERSRQEYTEEAHSLAEDLVQLNAPLMTRSAFCEKCEYYGLTPAIAS